MSRTEHFDAGHNMPEHNVAPGRFRYSPSRYSADIDSQEDIIEGTYDVHVGKEKIGEIKRNERETDGYYGSWRSAGEDHSTRRAASMHVWNKHIAKKNEDQE
jgi:hypothetical protein